MQEFSLKEQFNSYCRIANFVPEDGVISYIRQKPPKFNYLIHSAAAHREVRPTNPKHIEKSIKTLLTFCHFMKDSEVKWYLTGGIAIDLVNGNSYREHGDLDIVLPIDQAEKLSCYLKMRKVAAYRRICTATYYADNRITFFKNCCPSQRDFGNHRTLKIFLKQELGLLPVIDIHFVNQQKDCCQLLYNRKIFSLPFQLSSGNQFDLLGNNIAICDLRLILFLKSDENPRNFYDAKRIAEALSVSDWKAVQEHKALRLVPLSPHQKKDHTLYSSHKASRIEK